MFLIAIHTGMRITSILGLRLEDVWHEGRPANRLRVRKSTIKGKRNGFDIPIHSRARMAISDYVPTRVAAEDCNFLFPGRRGYGPLHRTQAWRIFRQAFRRAGIYGGMGELGCHATRKTFARRVYEALNFDLIRTSHALHHADISSTIDYLSFDEDAVDDAILGIDFLHPQDRSLPGFAMQLEFASLKSRFKLK